LQPVTLPERRILVPALKSSVLAKTELSMPGDGDDTGDGAALCPAIYDCMLDINRLLLSSTELQQVLANVAAGVCELASYDRCLIATVGPDNRDLVGRAGFGIEARQIGDLDLCLTESPCLQGLLAGGKPVVLQCEESHHAVPQPYLDLFRATGTIVVVPLVHAGAGLVGVLFVDRQGLEFTREEAELETLTDFADLATLAVRRAQNAHEDQRLASLLDRSQIVAALDGGVTGLLSSVEFALRQALDAPGLPLAVADVIRGTDFCVAKASDQLRRALAPPGHDSKGTNADIVKQVQALASGFTELTGISVELELHGHAGDPSPEGERLLIRTVREGLANVLKHAEATHVLLVLNRNACWWMVEVHDNGTKHILPPRAFPCHEVVLDSKAFGLASLGREAARVGGFMWLAASPRFDGTQLSVGLQLQPW
jgi:GAF domain-containing protein